ncbi:hypothetical protein N7540_004776 [Penicillium herquei]|nr:hypothetical protein N7540_004776 [Penicillium herquei]
MMAPRKHSGRDPKKALGQKLALGPGPIVRRPQSHNLVICGSTDDQDYGWIFGDFMGICSALNEYHIRGDFLSCFPLKAHFDFLQQQTPPIKTIKFGYFWPNRVNALHTYSKERFDRGHLWWMPVKPSELLSRIIDWFTRKQSAAMSGDVINIILEGHGHEENGFMAGESFLYPAMFANLISHFRPKVQVNVFPDFCCSGSFIIKVKQFNPGSCYMAASADAETKSWSHSRSVSGRVRNGRFVTALVMSLANTNSTSSKPWSIQDHEKFMIDQLTRNITPGGKVAIPQFWSSADLDRSLPLNDLLFRHMVSCPSGGRRASGRNPQVEWPTTNLKIQLSLGSTRQLVKNSVSGAVTKVVQDEMARCDTTLGYPPDIGVHNQMYVKDPDWRGILRNLYWRFQRQYVVWEIYLILADRGFVEASALTLPMDLFSPDKYTRRVTHLLCLFSNILDDDDLAFKGKIALQSTGWDLDLAWLATVIVRSGCEYQELFRAIQESGYLGKMNWKAIELMKELDATRKTENPEDHDEIIDADDIVAPTTQPFGVWLPNGLSIQDAHCLTKSGRGPCLARFHEIEDVFFETEKIEPELLTNESESVAPVDEAAIDNQSEEESSDEQMVPLWLLEES